MPLTPGTRLGAYEIIAPLGAGGMGEVYRARDPRLGRDVAVKVLPTESLHDETARARLLREARLAATLNHPNICTVHEVGEAGGHVYIAMELVEGRPRQALKLDPANTQAFALMSYAFERVRRYPEALAAARRAGDLDPAQDTLFIAALCAAEGGDRALAERHVRSLAVEKLAGRDFEYEAARVFAVLGRGDDAFRLLNHAADQRDERLALLIQDPWLASLRSDPRFTALLRRMGLRA